MSSNWIPASLRALVHERAAGFCEYCRIHESDISYPHEPDHIIGSQHGGPTVPENLALACFHCNRRKGPNISSIDPMTGELSALFHPRRHRWAEHFHRDEERILGLTSVGRATVNLLEFNSMPRLELRRALLNLGRHA